MFSPPHPGCGFPELSASPLPGVLCDPWGPRAPNSFLKNSIYCYDEHRLLSRGEMETGRSLFIPTDNSKGQTHQAWQFHVGLLPLFIIDSGSLNLCLAPAQSWVGREVPAAPVPNTPIPGQTAKKRSSTWRWLTPFPPLFPAFCWKWG